MNKLILIQDAGSKGKITLYSPRKNSKIIRITVSLDDYGFQVEIPKEQLKELIEWKKVIY